MQHLNDACTKWKEKENIDFSLYGTPIESTTYKFAKCLQKRFGKIEGVTDKNYITNSYHIHVTEHINAFDKLTFESQFQKLSPGGAISYVEVPDMQDNIDAVLAVMKHIYNNIMYAELNTKSLLAFFSVICSPIVWLVDMMEKSKLKKMKMVNLFGYVQTVEIKTKI